MPTVATTLMAAEATNPTQETLERATSTGMAKGAVGGR